MKNKIAELENFLMKNLDEHRIAHSYSTLATALNLKKIFKLKISDIDIIITAISHDFGKCMKYEDMLNLILKEQIKLDEFEKKHKNLWHGHISAHLLEKKFKIKKANILKAVKHHTTGHINMSNLLKIIYIADYVEPLRKHQIVDICQYKNIDTLLLEIINKKLEYLKKNEQTAAVHP
ncbi:MAG TPA: bis(5'-nucleosyl)-tetraphosphatase (symmetrical) YqeK, partial [bacterium]|nr:bis(5'-nucleosyl)-tetraphosphatase (symmetrical) YqeK [bacterium]